MGYISCTVSAHRLFNMNRNNKWKKKQFSSTYHRAKHAISVKGWYNEICLVGVKVKFYGQ